MKKLLLALLLAAGSAMSATVATTTNDAGGLAVLTDIACENNKGLVAYSVYSGSKTLFGCWFTDDNFIFIRWSDGEIRSYPYGIWNIKSKKKGTEL